MTTDEEYFSSWRQILEVSAKSSTLKFALARALIDLVSASKMSSNDQVVTKHQLARKLLEYYWFQVFRYRLRQTTNPLGVPKVVEILSEMWPDPARAPARVDSVDSQVLVHALSRVESECFREVIPRFHRVRGERQVTRFFRGRRGHIVVSHEAAAFIRAHEHVLRQLVILQWSLWLERINSAPRIASKVAAEGEPRRKRLTPILKLLRTAEARCFYCGIPLENLPPGRIHVDHVIPWTYIFEDAVWNLVLACASCNSSKGNCLPAKQYIQKLSERNMVLLNKAESNLSKLMFNSLLPFGDNPTDSFHPHLFRIYESASDDGFPGPWVPSLEPHGPSDYDVDRA